MSEYKFTLEPSVYTFPENKTEGEILTHILNYDLGTAYRVQDVTFSAPTVIGEYDDANYSTKELKGLKEGINANLPINTEVSITYNPSVKVLKYAKYKYHRKDIVTSFEVIYGVNNNSKRRPDVPIINWTELESKKEDEGELRLFKEKVFNYIASCISIRKASLGAIKINFTEKSVLVRCKKDSLLFKGSIRLYLGDLTDKTSFFKREATPNE